MPYGAVMSMSKSTLAAYGYATVSIGTVFVLGATALVVVAIAGTLVYAAYTSNPAPRIEARIAYENKPIQTYNNSRNMGVVSNTAPSTNINNPIGYDYGLDRITTSTFESATCTSNSRLFDDIMSNDAYKKYAVDCSEIAEDLYRVLNKGTIYHILPKVSMLKVYEYGIVKSYYYHDVFGYLGYIYDPRYSPTHVLKDLYFKALGNINSNGFNVFKLKMN